MFFGSLAGLNESWATSWIVTAVWLVLVLENRPSLKLDIRDIDLEVMRGDRSWLLAMTFSPA